MPAGHLTVIIGPMFAGKTTELLRRLRRHKIAERRVVLFKYDNDTRYSDDKVCTHDQVKEEAFSFSIMRTMKDDDFDAWDVIGIDEVHFLESQDVVFHLVNELEKIVIVSGLDADFRMQPFPVTLALIPQAETVLKLHAVCVGCKGDASFSKRTTNETETEVIGGKDKYAAMCRRCFGQSHAERVH